VARRRRPGKRHHARWQDPAGGGDAGGGDAGGDEAGGGDAGREP
jgi:hypothetical protein